jgi:hypothetical protein
MRKAFMFKILDIFYSPTPEKEVMIYKAFSGSAFTSIDICRFKYLKGRK